MSIRYRDATASDAETLANLFQRVFDETFGHLYRTADRDSFMAQHGVDQWREQLSDPAYAVRLAENDQAAGYAKLGPLRLPVQTSAPGNELRQLYVAKDFHGSGVAVALMDWTIEEARRRGAHDLYLSVFTENQRARGFYGRYGFEEVGPYKFMVGNQADEDIIMRLAL
jgi:ribosomal protein S18 acetylase RimI-like enzyme